MFLKISQNSQETPVLDSFLIKLQAESSNFIKKEILAQLFSCEFCKFFKNTYLIEHMRRTASYVFGVFATSLFGFALTLVRFDKIFIYPLEQYQSQ